MKVYYALYDQSYDNNAQYWTWFPEEITKQMRDAIASKSGAFQMRPKRPNLLAEPDIVGGIINYQDQWCVVYRFFNGGNDPQGRPDRCVLATAWVKAEDAQGQNLYALLFCPVFLNVQKQALYQCPVQAPKALIENCNCPVSQNDPQLVIYKSNPNIGTWSFRNPDEAEVIGKLFPNLIGDGLKSLQVLQSASYMETFSGTPLASGITHIPKVEIPPEPAYIGGDFPVQQSPSRNLVLVFLLAIFFILASLMASDYLTNHRIIKSVFQVIGVIKGQFSEDPNPADPNLDVQNLDVQNLDVQNLDVQNQDVQNQDVQNQDVQNQDVQNQDVQNLDVQNQDVQNQDVQNQDVQNQEVQNQDVQNQDAQNQDVQNQDVQNQDVQNQDVQNQDVQNQDVQNQDVQNQDVQNQDVQNQDVQNQDVQNQDVQNQDVQNPNGQNLNWQNPNGQNPNGQNPERPNYPPKQQINPGNLPTEPNNGMLEMPLTEL